MRQCLPRAAEPMTLRGTAAGDSVIHCTPRMRQDPHDFGAMPSLPPEMFVDADTFRVSRESVLLVSELRAALAVCVYDDTQGVGGLLHLRYVATSNDQPIDLTDNTLSSALLLMDRFCKELRGEGARKGP